MVMKRNKIKEKVVDSVDTIELQLYPGNFTLILSDNLEFIDNFCEGEKVININDPFASAFTVYNEKSKERHFVVNLNFNHEYKITHGIVSHEVYHVVNMIVGFIGNRIVLDNDENEAILTEWITNTIYGFLKKRKIVV